MIKVLIFGQTLREAIDEQEIECEVAEPMTVWALLESHSESFQPLQPFLNSGQLMITVNQKVSTLETQVKDGDTIKLTHQIHPDHEGIMWHNP
jgi:molybdopterin synthase sulfur carrier subunit